MAKSARGKKKKNADRKGAVRTSIPLTLKFPVNRSQRRPESVTNEFQQRENTLNRKHKLQWQE